MTPAGLELNKIAQEHLPVSAIETATLFAQDRRELQSFRKPLLDSGVSIISSRCDLTTYAYQGFASGVSFEEIYEIHKGILVPDMTLVLMISVETMLARLGDRRGTKELYEQEDFLRKCHEGYLQAIEFLKTKGRKILVIDGE